LSAMTAVALDLPVLSDGLVLLRPFAAKDAAELAAIWRDPTIRLRNGVPEPSQEAAVRWVAERVARAAAGEAWEWAIVNAATDELAGRRALKDIEWEHRRAVAACWVAPGFRGRQFAARSLRLAAAHAFARDIARVQAECEADNEGSIRSVLAAGMRYEGTLRSYFTSNAGVPVDAQVFGLLPDDLATAPALRAIQMNNE
jgi:RimJ/RimL family protein N-acetyltransferase